MTAGTAPNGLSAGEVVIRKWMDRCMDEWMGVSWWVLLDMQVTETEDRLFAHSHNLTLFLQITSDM